MTLRSTIHRYESPFFTSNDGNHHSPSSALIILNTPIINLSQDRDGHTTNEGNDDGDLSGVLGVLWKASSYRVCADGGANRLYDATVAMMTRKKEDGVGINDAVSNNCNPDFLPDLITGDLDSLRSDVRMYYETKGVPVIRVQDQNYHDLDKSLMAVEKWFQSAPTIDANSPEDDEVVGKMQNELMKKSTTFIYGGFGGRFDQEMAVVNSLCVWGKKETFQRTNLILYDEQTCAFILPEMPIKSEIRIKFPWIDSEDKNIIRRRCHGIGEGPTCGLIPIMGRCEIVKTTGLQWNLNGDVPLEFGGLVSSSNRIVNDLVTIETSSPMLFTTEIIVRHDC